RNRFSFEGSWLPAPALAATHNSTAGNRSRDILRRVVSEGARLLSFLFIEMPSFSWSARGGPATLTLRLADQNDGDADFRVRVNFDLKNRMPLLILHQGREVLVAFTGWYQAHHRRVVRARGLAAELHQVVKLQSLVDLRVGCYRAEQRKVAIGAHAHVISV